MNPSDLIITLEAAHAHLRRCAHQVCYPYSLHHFIALSGLLFFNHLCHRFFLYVGIANVSVIILPLCFVSFDHTSTWSMMYIFPGRKPRQGRVSSRDSLFSAQALERCFLLPSYDECYRCPLPKRKLSQWKSSLPSRVPYLSQVSF
jgi:hypothetical protein